MELLVNKVLICKTNAKTSTVNVNTIIFDLGGVIINLDYNRTANAFKALGVDEFDVIYSQKKQERLFDDFEKGSVSPEQFRTVLKQYINKPVSDLEIDQAWNAMLLDIPVEKMELLNQLRNKYRIFLLSNTNIIHVKAFTAIVENAYGLNAFEKVFEKVYYSCFLNMRKPDQEIFELVINENKLNKEETVFIDDSLQHVEGARRTGIHGIHLTNTNSLPELLKQILVD